MGQFAHLGEVEGLNQIAIPILRTDPANANKAHRRVRDFTHHPSSPPAKFQTLPRRPTPPWCVKSRTLRDYSQR